MRRSALEQRIAEVQPYQYTNMVKLQKERLPRKGSLKFMKIDSVVYKDIFIKTTEESVVFKVDGLPFTEEFEMNSYFDKSISDCIQERLLFAFTIIPYGQTSKSLYDYLYLNGGTLDTWDSVRIIYTIHETYMVFQTTQTMTLDDLVSALTLNKIETMIYPIEFSKISLYDANGYTLCNMNDYEVDRILTQIIKINDTTACGTLTITTPYYYDALKHEFNLSRLIDENINVVISDKNNNYIDISISYIERVALNIFKIFIETSSGTLESLGLDFINNEYLMNCTIMQYKMPEKVYYTCYDTACQILKDTTDIGTPEETLCYITNPDNAVSSNIDTMALNTRLYFWDPSDPEDEVFRLRLSQILWYDISIIDDLLSASSYQFESFKTNGIALKRSYDNITRRISIPLRNLENTHNTIVLLFKNGTLYDKYDTILYRFGTVTFEYDEAYETDIYEIVYIHGVQYYPDKVCNVGDTVDLPLNLDEYEFYMKTPDNQYFPDLNLSNTYQIKATDIVLINTEGTMFTISSVAFPVGTELICTMVNKYRYVSYTITEECINISLPDSFKYCQNKNQYMVFLNGRKINNDDFIIVKPTQTTPFYELSIFSKIVFEKNDKLDIFYIPVIPFVKSNFDVLRDNSLYIQYEGGPS